MKDIMFSICILSLISCTRVCEPKYEFELLYVIPSGDNKRIYINEYYLKAKCSSSNWDTSAMKRFIMSNKQIIFDTVEKKKIRFYKVSTPRKYRNQANLDEVKIDKYLIAEYLIDDTLVKLIRISKK